MKNIKNYLFLLLLLKLSNINCQKFKQINSKLTNESTILKTKIDTTNFDYLTFNDSLFNIKQNLNKRETNRIIQKDKNDDLFFKIESIKDYFEDNLQYDTSDPFTVDKKLQNSLNLALNKIGLTYSKKKINNYIIDSLSKKNQIELGISSINFLPFNSIAELSGIILENKIFEKINKDVSDTITLTKYQLIFNYHFIEPNMVEFEYFSKPITKIITYSKSITEKRNFKFKEDPNPEVTKSEIIIPVSSINSMAKGKIFLSKNDKNKILKCEINGVSKQLYLDGSNTLVQWVHSIKIENTFK